MEELRNENMAEPSAAEEPVIEQRPSTKYGRTAYQQQLREEQAAQIQKDAYEETYRNIEQPYQQYSAYTPYEEARIEITPLYAHILMVVVAITQVISFIINTMMTQAYNMGETVEEVFDAMLLIAQEPEVWVLSTISDFLILITIAFVVLDIIQMHKAGKKTGLAIAFAIFLRPVYFIWRAHLLGQKKLVSIIFAIAMYAITFVQYYLMFSAALEMVIRTMS